MLPVTWPCKGFVVFSFWPSPPFCAERVFTYLLVSQQQRSVCVPFVTVVFVARSTATGVSPRNKTTYYICTGFPAILLSLKCITNRSSADRTRPRLSGHFARALSGIRGPYDVESTHKSSGERDQPTITLCKKHVSESIESSPL